MHTIPIKLQEPLNFIKLPTELNYNIMDVDAEISVRFISYSNNVTYKYLFYNLLYNLSQLTIVQILIFHELRS